MMDQMDIKGVVKNIVDGTFDRNLCRICLLPLGDVCENIFTRICKEDQEFCVADVLEVVCQVQFSEADNYNVCTECLIMATTAYKFFILSKRSNEIMHFYVQELEKHVYSIEVPDDTSHDTLCITLPVYSPSVENLDCSIEGCLTDEYFIDFDDPDAEAMNELQESTDKEINTEPKEDDENLVLVVEEKNGKRTVYKLANVPVKKENVQEAINSPKNCYPEKTRRKRDTMKYKQCSQCPVRYKFIAKLQVHMKNVHNIDLFVCNVCKALIEDKEEFESHLAFHTNVHRCNICNTVFKKRDTIIAHLEWHEAMKNMINLEGAHVCEMCGYILPNEEQLKDHYDKKHDKKYNCFYCGKMYKGELAFETHIRKHELQIKKRQVDQISGTTSEDKTKEKTRKSKNNTVCPTCGKNFVDERSLTWHSMLHTNERPYKCDVCGRGFICVTRRNQHAVCAHTAPAKRCPLCPALFHLRSMVNTHIKKVHLNAHKRRHRTSKHQNVNWRTEPVPIQELSISIQNELLELQTFTSPAESRANTIISKQS